MKKLEQIISEVVSDMNVNIVDSLCARQKRAEVERYYGEAYIIAEVGIENLNNGYYLPYKKAVVCHQDEHHSPLLEQAIMDALPNWDDMEKEFNEAQREYEENIFF